MLQNYKIEMKKFSQLKNIEFSNYSLLAPLLANLLSESSLQRVVRSYMYYIFVVFLNL